MIIWADLSHVMVQMVNLKSKWERTISCFSTTLTYNYRNTVDIVVILMVGC